VLIGTPLRANAQRVFFGAGGGAASVPRSLHPLCGSARRLAGPTFTAQAGFLARRLRVSTALDFTARGYDDAASCIPRSGVSVDSIFAEASNSELTASGDIWFIATRLLSASVGAGWVPDGRSWFASGGIGAQYRRVRVEFIARRHRTKFDEITRDFTTPGGVREISRSSRTEESWGGVVHLLLVTR
jgi:hypothetical protein